MPLWSGRSAMRYCVSGRVGSVGTMPRGVSLCGCSVTRCVCAAVSLCSEALCRRHFFVRYLYCGYAAAGRERALVFAIKRRSRIIFLKNLKYLFPRKSLLRGFFVVWLGRGLQPAAFRQTSSADFCRLGRQCGVESGRKNRDGFVKLLICVRNAM